MNAVAQRPEAVDTLSAWLTAHLAAPDTATKAYFTVSDLLEAAGMPHSTENLSAMARAAGRAGLIQARRYVDGALLRAWFRHPHAMLAQQAAARLDQQEALAREHLRVHIDRVAGWASMAHHFYNSDIGYCMDAALARHRHAVQTTMARLDKHCTPPNESGWTCNDYPHGEQLLHRPDRRARPRGARRA